jgi:hypothetical protein
MATPSSAPVRTDNTKFVPGSSSLSQPTSDVERLMRQDGPLLEEAAA